MRRNIFLVAVFIAGGGFLQGLAQAATIKVTGAPELVFNWRSDKCEDEDIPDTHARAFRDDRGKIIVIATHHINRLMRGDDFNNLHRDCHVIMDSHKDAIHPGRFDDMQWLSGIYTTDGRHVYALTHNEYHDPQCSAKEGVKCWYNGITLSLSNDGGNNFKAAPKHLVASVPFKYTPNSGPLGAFGPSNIILNHKDGYYYAMFVAFFTPEQQKKYGISTHVKCLMRTKDLADPKSWRAWDGQGFKVRFINPYLAKNIDPAKFLFKPIAPESLRDMDVGNITFNTVLNRFVLVGVAHTPDPATGQMTAGIAYSFSDDLIHWTPTQLLFKSSAWGYKPGDPDPTGYPSFIDHESLSRNFETTGKNFYLYYTRFNYGRPHQGRWDLDRDLVRVPVEIQGSLSN